VAVDPVLPEAAEGIEFLHGRRVVRIERCEPTQTLLDWLRDEAGDCSVKEGCAEGDCGACTVGISERDVSGRVHTRAINACIRFLPTLHGCQVHTPATIAEGGLHPVQHAMVEHHASQCGFCTPGFVMSLWAWRESRLAAGNTAPPNREEVLDVLSGNLCRCTGYRPIIEAALSVPMARQPGESIVSPHDAPARGQAQAFIAGPSGQGFFMPRTPEVLDALRAEHPNATLLAGSTDIGLWVTKQFKELGHIIWLGRVAGLDRIEALTDGSLVIGAAVTLEQAWDVLRKRYPRVNVYLRRFASLPIRNAGTAEGNLANGSPIGDLPPLMLALDARLRLRRQGRQREVALKDFYLGYQQKDLQPGEWVESVLIPAPVADQVVLADKISRRLEQDISAVALCLSARVVQGHLSQVRLGVGGMAAIPSRAFGAEGALEGLRLADLGACEAAADVLAAEFKPISDMRASASYRREALRGALLRQLDQLAARESVRLEQLSPLGASV
jgi:xanthine dehydrogenase small subunit